ncbi:MAG TPA: DUF2512 family protein [Firmicutes bacterium]|nr:DUF2512 family protein [Bacillota bacterium]
MNDSWKALLVKFVMTFVFAWLTFGLIDRNGMTMVLLLSVAVTILNYIVGDLYALRTSGNLVASVTNGLLGALLAYMADILSAAFATTGTALAAFAGLLIIGEYVFHLRLLGAEKARSR